MDQFVVAESFEQWRSEARRLLAREIDPSRVQWNSDARQPTLFDSADQPDQSADGKSKTTSLTVPKAFLELAKLIACHRDPIKWQLLYRTLWRITHGEKHLLQIATDDDVHALGEMRKDVTRDVHKMKAFVRFRKLEATSEDTFVAWYRPDHLIVRLAAPFFSRRFKAMNWTIMTPDESVVWDQSELHYGPGVPASEAPDQDALEDLWRTYYASIFNPARIKVGAMKREMPVRHWATLPEADIIDDLLRDAPSRVEAMIAHEEGFETTATRFMPESLELDALRTAAQSCRACDLCHDATQTVFGSGPETARIVIVGEQPGDQEDRVGQPFVGPAGQLLDQAFQQSGIDRNRLYLTNVVKHFKFVLTDGQRGKRRLHQKPGSREIYACRPWLEAELQSIRPSVLVCLGATAAQALMGRDFRITQHRGQLVSTEWCDHTIASWHPAAILRQVDADRQQQMKAQLIGDLVVAASL